MTQVPLAPPPQTGKDPQNERWLYLLWKRISSSGQVLWSYLDFTGSNLTDLATRNHVDLQSLQGGTTGEHYHVTAATFNNAARLLATVSTAINATMDDTAATWIVTATGKTITLPNATTARQGLEWTVHLATAGNMTIAADASDTIMTSSGADTSVYTAIQASSITFRCTSSSTWIIV